MAVILESKTQSEKELTEALEANGLKVEPKEAKADETKPVVEEKKTSEPTETKVEKTEVEGSESESDKESDEKDTSQEKPQGEEKKESKGEGDKPKSRGGFQKRVDDLTRQKAMVEDLLEVERGSKVALQKQLDELNGKLAVMQPKEPEKPAELARPKRPLLKDFDFDQDKLDAALDQYDAKLDEYHTAVADKKTKAEVAAFEERIKTEREQETVRAQEQAYVDRLNKGKAVYEDFDELATALPGDAKTLVDKSKVVANYITFKSKDPVHLVRFLIDDFLNNGEAEANRFMQMDDYDQAYAIKELESRLIREHAKESKSGKADEETKAEEKPVPEVKATPAKEKPRVEAPDAPIKPVGSTAHAKGKSLDEQMREAADAGDPKTFNKLFAQQQQEKQAARA